MHCLIALHVLSLGRFGDRQGALRGITPLQCHVTVEGRTNGRLGNDIYRYVSGAGAAAKLACRFCPPPELVARLQNAGMTVLPVDPCPDDIKWTDAQETNAWMLPQWKQWKQIVNLRLGGFLHSHHYHTALKQRPLTFSKETRDRCSSMVQKACPMGVKVSMHVRGGDYMSGLNLSPHADHYRPWVADGCNIVVSDSPGWVRKHIPPSVAYLQSSPAVDMCIAGSGTTQVLGGGTFDFFAAYFAKHQDVHMDRRQFRWDMAGEQELASYAPQNWIEHCATNKGMWHLMVIWGHGLQYDTSIWHDIHNMTGLVMVYQKQIHFASLADVIEHLYREDIDRIGKEHIDAKSQFLFGLTNADTARVVVLYDTDPKVTTTGVGKWKMAVNQRMVKLKWGIRKKFNPKLTDTGKRDQYGVFSHHHVVHISDTDKGVDDMLQYLHLPTTATLAKTHANVFTPWHIHLPDQYAIQNVDINTLLIGCATSVGACGNASKVHGGAVLVRDSAHYAFTSGHNKALYEKYYRAGVTSGTLTDDHTSDSFQQLQQSFRNYPTTHCGFDGKRRQSIIIVNGRRIVDGAHRAAILLANNNGKKTVVPVVQTQKDNYEIQPSTGDTIVTAYYKVKSKHSEQEYRTWMANMLAVQCPMVIFADASSEPLIKRLRGEQPTRIVVLSIDDMDWQREMPAPIKYGSNDSSLRHVSTRLFQIWHSKREYVTRAIALNPFHSDRFWWIDIGSVRDGTRWGKWPAQTQHLPADKVAVAWVDQPYNHVTCSLWGGTRFALLRDARSYYQALARRVKEGKLISKDTEISDIIVAAHPERYYKVCKGWFCIWPALVANTAKPMPKGHWRTINDLWRALENTPYAVLRNFEKGTLHPHDRHPDIDILLGSRDACVIATGSECTDCYHQAKHITIGRQAVLLDIRIVGDKYYDADWARQMINRRAKIRTSTESFWALSKQDYYYSLLYHMLVHKPSIPPDYPARLCQMGGEGSNSNCATRTPHEWMDKLIFEWMIPPNNYSFSRPCNKQVTFRPPWI